MNSAAQRTENPPRDSIYEMSPTVRYGTYDI